MVSLTRSEASCCRVISLWNSRMVSYGPRACARRTGEKSDTKSARIAKRIGDLACIFPLASNCKGRTRACDGLRREGYLRISDIMGSAAKRTSGDFCARKEEFKL